MLRSTLFFLLMLVSSASAATKTIVFLGDSLTAGYGLSEGQAFPSLIQQSLESDGFAWKVTNAGISGDTTSGGLKRLPWVLKSTPTVVFVALGANDGLRGLDPELTRKNLDAIISRLKKAGSKVVLAGMQLPLNYGADYRKHFNAIYGQLAQKHGVPFYPFLLVDVAAKPELNLSDGVHPNEKGQEILAKNVYRFLKPILQKI